MTKTNCFNECNSCGILEADCKTHNNLPYCDKCYEIVTNLEKLSHNCFICGEKNVPPFELYQGNPVCDYCHANKLKWEKIANQSKETTKTQSPHQRSGGKGSTGSSPSQSTHSHQSSSQKLVTMSEDSSNEDMSQGTYTTNSSQDSNQSNQGSQSDQSSDHTSVSSQSPKRRKTTSGKKIQPSTLLTGDLNWGNVPSTVTIPKTGTLLSTLLNVDVWMKSQRMSTYIAIGISLSSAKILCDLLRCQEDVMFTGVAVALVNLVQPGKKPVLALFLRTPERSIGTAIVIKGTLSSMNFEAVSTLPTFSSGLIHTPALWKRKDLPLSSWQNAYGSLLTYTLKLGIPKLMKRPWKLL